MRCAAWSQTMTWLSTNSVPLLFLLVIAGLGSWGAYTQQRAERLLQDNQQLTRQRIRRSSSWATSSAP